MSLIRAYKPISRETWKKDKGVSRKVLDKNFKGDILVLKTRALPTTKFKPLERGLQNGNYQIDQHTNSDHR